jgi:chromosome segregation ATPase
MRQGLAAPGNFKNMTKEWYENEIARLSEVNRQIYGRFNSAEKEIAELRQRAEAAEKERDFFQSVVGEIRQSLPAYSTSNSTVECVRQLILQKHTTEDRLEQLKAKWCVLSNTLKQWDSTQNSPEAGAGVGLATAKEGEKVSR